MKPLAYGVCFVMICAFGCSRNSTIDAELPAYPVNSDLPAAPDILATMAEAYSSCETYSDTGTATTILISKAGLDETVKPFATSFVRTGNFRFQFTETDDPNSLYVVWTDRKNVLTWWDVNQANESEDSLGIALAGATGVSGGSAHTIPALLMPDQVGGRALTEIRDLTRGSDDTIDGVACFVIHGRYAHDPITIWIEKETYLVRRIDSKSAFSDFTSEDSTVYSPRFDSKIDAEELEFGLPQ